MNEAVHHLGAVQVGEPLRPPQLADVLPELGDALREVRKVTIRQVNMPCRAQLLGNLDVLLRDLVPDTATARVQEQPHPVGFVQAQLDEVVSTSEGSELLSPLRGVGEVDIVLLCASLKLGDLRLRIPLSEGLGQVVVAGRQRDRLLDGLPEFGESPAVGVGVSLST